MSLLLFIIYYAFSFIFGTLAITGWYLITRGEKEILPNGKTKYNGKIFKWWYFFWMQERPLKKIFFQGRQLEDLYNEYLQYYHCKNKYDLVLDPALVVMEIGIDDPERRDLAIIEFEKELSDFEALFNVRVYKKGNGVYSFYKEYTNYLFPEIIRMPIAACATCFGSIYGSLVFAGFVFLPGWKYVFAWAPHMVYSLIFFWILFCFSLTVTNTAIAKKYA